MKRLYLLLLAASLCFGQGIPYHQIRITPTATFSAVGEVDFAGQTNSHFVGLAAPNTVGADILFRLPGADGSAGNCLVTDGAKNLSFTACSGGSVTPPVTWTMNGGTTLTVGNTGNPGIAISASGSGVSPVIIASTSGSGHAIEGDASGSGIGVYAQGSTGNALYVSGTSNFTGQATMPGGAVITGLTVNAGATINSGLIENGNAQVSGELDVDTALYIFGTAPKATLAVGAGTTRYIYYDTVAAPPSGALQHRWSTGASGSAETGSNVGSDYLIGRYNDAGTLLDFPLQITRSSGAVFIQDNFSVSGTVSGTHLQNLGGGDTPSFNGLSSGSGSVSGTHLQNLGTGDSPTFSTMLINGTGTALQVNNGSVSFSNNVNITGASFFVGSTTISGTHLQNLGTGDSPTFSTVVAASFQNSGWNFNTHGSGTWTASTYYTGSSTGVTSSTCSHWTGGICDAP